MFLEIKRWFVEYLFWLTAINQQTYLDKDDHAHIWLRKIVHTKFTRVKIITNTVIKILAQVYVHACIVSVGNEQTVGRADCN